MGIPVRLAKAGEYGTYRTPGGTLKQYSGMIEGHLTVMFNDKINFTFSGAWVFDHSSPLILLGSDVLRGGRPLAKWNFGGFVTDTAEDGKVTGAVRFKKGD